MRALTTSLAICGLSLSTLLSPVAAQADEVDAKWALVWADEFNGTSLDMDKWSYEDDCWGGGNLERQCYTEKTENVEVSDDLLTIRAIKKKTRGFANTRAARDGEVALSPGSKRYERVLSLIHI